MPRKFPGFQRKPLSVALLCALNLTLSLDSFAQTAPKPASPAPQAPVTALPQNSIANVALPPPAPVPAGAPKPFKEVIRDAKEMKGFFSLFQKDDKVWLEIKPEQLNKPFFFSYNVTDSVGERGLYASQMGNSYHAVFKKIGNHVQLIAKNLRYFAAPGTPQARTVEQGFSDSLLASAPVASLPHPDSKGFLIDASALLFSDIPSYSTRLEFAYRLTYAMDRSNTSFTQLNVDDTLTGIGISSHFFVPRLAAPPLVPAPVPVPQRSATLQDPRSLFVGFYYNFAALPETVMAARNADDRVGHFVTTSQDFTDDINPKNTRHLVNRWRLEKKDPTAALSEPKQAIVYWIDKNVPEKYRESVAAGVLEWNKAFEKIGYKNAIVVKQQADSDRFDTLDAHHASIRWFVGADVGFAIGPSKVDERSGEILDADIGMSDTFARGARRQIAEDSASEQYDQHDAAFSLRPDHDAQCRFARDAALEFGFAQDLLEARGELDADGPKAEALAQAYVKDVIMHEVGHTLGLRHNFRASTIYSLKQIQDSAFTKVNGLAGSVMDYIPFNLATKGEAQGEYVMSTLGPYDYWAIEYAYKPLDANQENSELAKIAARSKESWLAFGTDEDSVPGLVADPDVNVFDLGSDPLAYIQKRVQLSRELWDRLQTRQLHDGDSYEALRRSFERGLSQFSRTVPLAVKYIGGNTFLRDHAGTNRVPFTPIEVEKQRQALKLIADNLFTAKSFIFSPELISRLGVDHFQRVGRTDVSVSTALLSMQTNALDQLMSDNVAIRLLNNREKVRDPKKILSLNELYSTLQGSIWSELNAGNDISAARRNLQREHLKRLVNILLRPAPNTPADARSLEREQAVQLLAAIRRTSSKPMSIEAKAHLQESLATLSEALKASLNRTGV